MFCIFILFFNYCKECFLWILISFHFHPTQTKTRLTTNWLRLGGRFGQVSRCASPGLKKLLKWFCSVCFPRGVVCVSDFISCTRWCSCDFRPVSQRWQLLRDHAACVSSERQTGAGTLQPLCQGQHPWVCRVSVPEIPSQFTLTVCLLLPLSPCEFFTHWSLWKE